VVPASWKHCIVTPVPKTNPPKTLNELRPISVTPILSRVFEKLFVRRYFYPSLPKNILQDQFAFRPTGSTTAALTYLFHHVTRLLATNDYVRCLLIDFSKAFDTVSHNVFLCKLETFGCSQVVINWLANYLTDRTQSLATPNGLTLSLKINRSIIQGSGIGPTSFVSVIADLHPLSTETIFCKYADDLTVASPASCSTPLLDEFNHVQEWANANRLKINIAKCKEIIFYKPGVKHVSLPEPICNIEQVTSCKLLGVFFNDSFSFAPHINYVIASAAQRYYLLKSTSPAWSQSAWSHYGL